MKWVLVSSLLFFLLKCPNASNCSLVDISDLADSSYEDSDISTLSTSSSSSSSVLTNEIRSRRWSNSLDSSSSIPRTNALEPFAEKEMKLTLEVIQVHHVPSAALHLLHLTTTNGSSSNQDDSSTSSNLGLGWCSKISFEDVKYQVQDIVFAKYTKQAAVAVRTANLLTSLFTTDSSSSKKNLSNDLLSLHKSFFWSLTQVTVDTDADIVGAGLAFDEPLSFPIVSEGSKGPIGSSSRPEHFAPYAYRTSSSKLAFVELNRSANKSDSSNNFRRESWFRNHSLNRTVLEQFSLDGNKQFVGLEDGYWTSPYLDCFAPSTWVVTFSVPFFGPSATASGKLTFKGVAMVTIDLTNEDIDQCSDDTTHQLFANTHKCHPETSQCLHIENKGFRRGSYTCHCRQGYYVKDRGANGSHYFNGQDIEDAYIGTLVGGKIDSRFYPNDFVCDKCAPGCASCFDDAPCFVSDDLILRGVGLALQSFCATICVILIVVIFRLRRDKTIASSRWIMLEMILFGAFLLYLTVIVRYFEPTPFHCLLEPWLREIGFGFCYGSITIKLYRILAEFRTRKAHRVCVRDKDLMKYLGGIIVVIVGYLAAWTVLLLDTTDEGVSNLSGKLAASNILSEGATPDGLRFHICKELSWDYVTEIGEILFLSTGVYITYSIRNARHEIYREKWTLCFCVYIETIVSTVAYVLRHIFWTRVHPDFIFVLYFIRCQLTVTVVLLILLGPKLWYHNRPQTTNSGNKRSRYFSSSDVESRSGAGAVPGIMRLHEAILSNGEVDIADINLADMDPEDIRSELRRVYTQLQVLRNKTMRKDNPHISKRRGGRKGTHRRFSLQPFHKASSHHSHQSSKRTVIEGPEPTEDVSRTPEESTASFEGPSNVQADGPSIAMRDMDSSAATATTGRK